METPADEVIQRFGRSAAAFARLERWRSDPTKALVVGAVESHLSKFVYELTPGGIEAVCARTEHALGNVRGNDAKQVSEIRDWHPNFAFTHVFHIVTEQLGEVPTYQEFRDHMRETDFWREALWEPSLQAIRETETNGLHQPNAARDAMRWRVGNAYYSFLRELYVLSLLRDSEIDVRVHPLADALFRVDFWIDELNVSLFIGNARFRQQQSGRKDQQQSGMKDSPELILADARPPFRFDSLELDARHEFGNVHLPAPAAVGEFLKRFKANGGEASERDRSGER